MRNHDVNDLFNNNALLNSLLRRSRNHLVRVNTARSKTRSCGITLTIHCHINDLFHCAVSTSVSLIIFSASSSVSFSPTFFFTSRTASHGSSPRQTTRWFTFVSVALVSGHPRPSVETAPVYRGCPCRDPLVWEDGISPGGNTPHQAKRCPHGRRSAGQSTGRIRKRRSKRRRETRRKTER